MKARKAETPAQPPAGRVLVLVDESNVVSSLRTLGRNLDWQKLRDFFTEATGGQIIETVVYVGLPPAMAEWQAEREKKNKFVHWLRSHGFLVVSKEGSPAEDDRYKANVDVMMAVDAVELCAEMRPNVVVLATGDADFAPLAVYLRRRGIRVVAASIEGNLGSGLKSTVNAVFDLGPLFASFEPMLRITRIGTSAEDGFPTV